MVKIKSHIIKSFFLKPLLVHPDQAFSVVIFITEDLPFPLVHLPFYDQYIERMVMSANPKITMQQGGIETLLIIGNQNNIALDLSIKWLSW